MRSVSKASEHDPAAGATVKKLVAAPPRDLPGDKPPAWIVFGRLVAADTKKPIAKAKYEVLDPAGGATVAQGETDFTGNLLHDVQKGGSYDVKLLDMPDAEPIEGGMLVG